VDHAVSDVAYIHSRDSCRGMTVILRLDSFPGQRTSQTPVSYYVTTRRQNPGNFDLENYRRESLKTRKRLFLT